MKKNFHTIILFCIIIFGTFLRFYQIDKFPPGLYIDEASIGSNAYSMLVSGKDEHGVQTPLFFKAFGEYKLPVYIYMTVASFKMFGVNETALRIPSALFGSLTIVVMYFFVKELFSILWKNQKPWTSKPEYIALLSTLLLAIAPWHIHFSRGGFEATVALFLYLFGCLMMLLFRRKTKVLFLLLACFSFAISVYTYSIYKFVAPLTFLTFLGRYFFIPPKVRNMLLVVTAVFIIFNVPMMLFSSTQEGKARFLETSAFTEYPIQNMADSVYLYPQVFLKDYLSFFSLDFLFVNGDGNGRHQIPGMGLFFKWQLPFLLIGIYWLMRQKNRRIKLVLFGMLLLAPIVPSVARPSPNTLRALLMVIPLIIIISCGLLYSFQLVKKFRYVFASMIVLLFVYTFVLYIHMYYFHYPIVNALDWGAAYKETVLKVAARKQNYTHIIFDKNLTFAKSYIQFYAPDMKVDYKPPDWDEFKHMNGNVLFVSIYYGDRNDAKRIDQIYLPGPNKTVYTQLWEL